MFLPGLPLPARLILLVGEGELDVSFLEGVRVHLGLVVAVYDGGGQVLVLSGPVHLNTLLRHLQWPLGCRHQSDDKTER